MTMPEESAEDDWPVEQDSFDDVVEDEGETESPLDDVGEWGSDELEAAYLKAMSTLEAVESENPAAQDRDEDGEADSDLELESPQPAESRTENAEAHDNRRVERALSSPSNQEQSSSFAELMSSPEEKAVSPQEVTEVPPVEARVTPRQIIEACLFVGGDALTSKRLVGVLRGEFDADYVDRQIDELNRIYVAENRPYEIRLGEGGFRMALREEFERIRNKVYGLGPKEVRLSQEALEVLAVVAYHQPIKQNQVEALGKPACGAILRQLVRRELLVVERDPAQPREVSYKTTSRFLSLFGIGNLDELPRHEQVAYK